MKQSELVNRRKISDTLNAPLLIPSFSSTIFGIENKKERKEIDGVCIYLKEKIKASLFSLFDINYKYINQDSLEFPDLLCLDSGNYEYEKYKKAGFRVKWSYDLYIETLKSIKRRKNVILVNYDYYGSIKSQIKKTQKLFNENCIINFIVKPGKNNYLVNIDDILSNIENIAQFNILGISEKELGDSLLDRCKNIIKLRSIINERKISLPLHIFGSLDPLSIILYFICGADMFDGLCWTKNGYYKNLAIYDNNYALLNGFDEFDSLNTFKIMLINNLKNLENLQRNLIDFSINNNWEVFELESEIEKKMKLLLSKAGLDILVN